jgi:hypothetical protein
VAEYTQGTPIEISDTFTVDGIPTDPTLVTYSILGPDGQTDVYVNGDPEVTNPAVGEYLLSLAPPGNPGSYSYSVVATGAVEAARFGSFYIIPNPAVPDADVEWAVQGVCEPWVSAQDVWECAGSPMTTIGSGSDEQECPVDMTPFALKASNVLFALGGRLHSGACQKTVRPCGERWCGFQQLSRGYIVLNPYWWTPYWDNYGWWWNGRHACGCHPLSTVKLSGYPVREIIEVLIDGVVVNPDTYRLDERRFLTRVADPAEPDVLLRWPACQRMDLPDTAGGTFSVTYRYGQDPPIEAVNAARQLGVEFYKACSGQDCALPTGIVRYTRQGVTVEKMAFTSWAYQRGRGSISRGWRTGMNLVDAYLSSANGAAIPRRPTFWSPSGRPYARSVGQ